MIISIIFLHISAFLFGYHLRETWKYVTEGDNDLETTVSMATTVVLGIVTVYLLNNISC